MATQKIDLNKAKVEDLETLIGIGHAKAEAIVEARKSLGGFSSVSDLMKIQGIGPGVLEQNRGSLLCTAHSRRLSRKSDRRSSKSSENSRVTSPQYRQYGNASDGQPSTSRSEPAQSSPSPEKVRGDRLDTKAKQDVADAPRHLSRLHHALRSCDELSKRHCDTEDSSDESVANSDDIGTETEDSSSSDREDCDQLSPISLPDKPQMKRKSDGSSDKEISPGKKMCKASEHDSLKPRRFSVGTFGGMSVDMSRRRIPSKSNPPPELANWLLTFQAWSNAERLMALDELIETCEPTQVRHMMAVIEPQFQRDFISLLPKELALYVLSFLEPKDLLRAAQTCRYWRILAEDNLLWREKCREESVDESLVFENRLRRKSSVSMSRCPWKSLFMRQHQIEQNWRFGPIRQPKVLKGHDDHVITCLEFSGNRIVSGSDDDTLKVWSAITGKCLRTLVGHTGGVWSSQMSANVIISGSTDRTLKVWNTDTGQCVHTLYGHTSTVRCMHLNGSKVVSGSRDATLRVWDIDSGQCLHVLMGHVAAVRCVQYDGRRVISGAYDYMVKVWDPETETCLHTLQGHTNRVYSLQFDGTHIVSGSLDTSIRVWDSESGNCLHTLIGHQSLTSGMELKDNTLVSGNADSTVKVWDITTGQCLQTLQGPNKHQSAVTALQFNKKFLITSSDDGTVKIWDLRTGDFLRNLVTLESGGSGGVVWRIRSSNTKLVCAVGSRNGTEDTKLLVLDFDAEEKRLVYT